jgi:hypothetical protein
MNPIGQAGNMFSNLFDKVPAQRAGGEEDLVGTILYLVSRAGVSLIKFSESSPLANMWSLAGLR